jgi:branched-chain amino acid transport system substrate-binding protein
VVSGTAIHHKLPFPGIAELNQAARERFNLPHAPLYFLFGYCWAQVLQQAVEATKSLSHAVLVRYMREGTFKTIAGEMKFDERGLPAPYEYTTQVINGAVELIWPPGRRSAQAVYPKPPWRR